jgi:hypothetical protein
MVVKSGFTARFIAEPESNCQELWVRVATRIAVMRASSDAPWDLRCI